MHTVKDSVDPAKPTYNAKAARAKLMSAGATPGQWGPKREAGRTAPTKTNEMECYTCHLSWTTSCAGCHLPIQANWKTERHHFEGGETRNFATYNPQVARDDMFQLGIHQTTKGNTIAPVRSTSALILSSTNINRVTGRIFSSRRSPPSGYSQPSLSRRTIRIRSARPRPIRN